MTRHIKRGSSKLHVWCFEKNITIQDFANILGVSRSLITRWNRGDRHPSAVIMGQIKKITKGFISTPQDLLNVTVQAWEAELKSPCEVQNYIT